MRSGFGAVAMLAVALTALRPESAAAQDPAPDDIESAKVLIESGAFTGARELLERRRAAEPANVEVLFLLGMIALAEGDYGRAVAMFRAALVHEPEATRIRLELARAFYLQRDFENAFRQFQFARAGDPPPEVVAAINQFLMAIRLEKNWSYNLNLAVAPDTNINNATSAREATFLGLPFELGDDARRRSGVGVAIDGGGEFAPRIGESARLRLGVYAQRRDYSGARFDDTTIALHAGPRFVLPGWDISLLGTAFERWYGTRRLNEGFGARVEGTYYPSFETTISLGLAAQELRYANAPQQSGPIVSVWMGALRALTASSSVTARIGATRQDAKAGEFANWSGLIGVGYYRDLAGGFSVYAEPRLGHASFDAIDPLFGQRRVDWTQELQIAVLNRRIVLSRFTPRLTYTFARRSSTIELHEFTQNRLEVGITTSF